MSIVRDTLRPFWFKGINEVAGKTSTSFRAWLTEGHYVFQNLTPPSDYLFYTADQNALTRSFAQDINRMSMASFESIHGIPSTNDIQRSTAWSLIRSYYSAFYAAHAICRIFGISISQIDSEQATKLNQAIALNSNIPQLQKGLYRISINVANNNFSMIKLARNSHEETWSQFGTLLDGIVRSLLTESDKISKKAVQQIGVQQTAALLMSILGIMRTPPCPKNSNWLSHLRNELNYKHMHGAWYPHECVSRFRKSVEYNITSWRQDPISIAPNQEVTLAKFSQGCALIVALMRELVEDIAHRNSKGDSFLKYGTLLVLRQCSVA